MPRRWIAAVGADERESRIDRRARQAAHHVLHQAADFRRRGRGEDAYRELDAAPAAERGCSGAIGQGDERHALEQVESGEPLDRVIDDWRATREAVQREDDGKIEEPRRQNSESRDDAERRYGACRQDQQPTRTQIARHCR